MKFILEQDMGNLAIGERAICLDRLSYVKKSRYEGVIEIPLKDIRGIPKEDLRDIVNFLNDAYKDVGNISAVYFVVDGVTTSVAVPNQSVVEEPKEPVKIGFAFNGWLDEDDEIFDFATLITKDTTLTASYTALEVFTVTFINGEDETTKDVFDGYLTTPPEIAPVFGFDLDGWFEEGGLVAFDFETPITDNITLTTAFTEWEKHTVTFDDGATTTPVSVYDGYTVDAPEDPVKEGHTFLGWFLGEAVESFDFSEPIEGDITLTAAFEADNEE